VRIQADQDLKMAVEVAVVVEEVEGDLVVAEESMEMVLSERTRAI
jgi:hypothetical protein